MKKLFVLSLAAAALSLAPQQAHAWKNIQFGVGLNLSYQSGDNTFCKGLWHNGSGHGGDYYGAPAFPEGPGFAPGGDFGHGNDFAPPPPAMHPTMAPSAPMMNQVQDRPANPFQYSSYQSGYYYGQYGW